MYMSRIRGPYVRFCERDEAVTPHPTRCVEAKQSTFTHFFAELDILQPL